MIRKPTSKTLMLKPTLLIVDDEPANLSTLADLLTHDYRVRATTSGMHALQAALIDPKPDLVLLDVMMPEIDGFEVLRRLRSEPRTREIPVIFLTALSDPMNEERGLEAGAVDYISKPIKALVLKARIRTQLEIRRVHQALEHQLQQKREILAGLSHEIGSPLSGINHVLDALQDGQFGELPAIQHKLVASASRTGRHLAGLIGDLMDAAKMEAGHLALDLEPCNLAEIAGEALDIVRPLAEPKRHRLTLREIYPCHALADRLRCRQILVNLLMNAIKYTPEEGCIRVAVRRRGEGLASVSVCDSGVGICRSVQPDLMRPFVRDKASLALPGWGLGLAVVDMLASLQGASIRLHSRPGRGTRVSIDFPRIPDTPAEATSTAAPP